ncbi:NmrA family NAD(P)-binding protein [Kribbella deserti]|uniref:NAD(P)H-binding protein n=1 Tax=Kribbella deserti TaxID=1926257 RepID=A0ABV6QM41_9ACTN
MTILVLGATGKTGRRVAERLQAKGVDFRAASRSAPTRFDWDDRATWADAVEGATAVYLVASDDPEPTEPFVKQAVAAGVRRFVVLSGRNMDKAAGRFGDGMWAAEQAVRASGAEWAFARANNFNQNFDVDFWLPAITAGRLALPIGDVGEPFIDLSDVADVVTELLTTDGHAGKIYELSGPESLTFAEAVGQISAAVGRPIEFVEITPEQYAEDLRAEGYPEEVATNVNGMFELMREGLLETPTDGVEQVLGRPAKSFRSYVRDVWAPGPR